MLTKTYSAAIQGIEAYTVEIEVNATGIGNDTIITVVGLPDTAVRESRERVWSAIHSSGFSPKSGRTTINLAPADIRKEGAGFDLPIALALIAAANGFEKEKLCKIMIAGELALDGTIRPIHGALAIALHAQKVGIANVLVPAENAKEAAMAENIRVYGAKNLSEAITFFCDAHTLPRIKIDLKTYFDTIHNNIDHDFADVKAQEVAKRAMEIAAAGNHNALMIGPPGSGKSMLAKRIPTILPRLTLPEALEVTKIHSISHSLPDNEPLIVQRPFRSPHHTISDAGLLGGQSMPKPGEISLAHNGVLFLDELPEFKRSVLEVLRQPLENGEVTISRAMGSFTFPSNFMLIAAMNPCPCGYYGSTQRQCRCNQGQIQRYRAKISGPLLDRIDIHVEVSAIQHNELMSKRNGESSLAIRQRVEKARQIQIQRFANNKVRCNADMSGKLMDKYCQLNNDAMNMLKYAINDLNLSARAYDRVLRVARTIADLDESENINCNHISEAIQYRTLDRQLW